MSYSIQTLIYGCPITDEVCLAIQEKGQDLGEALEKLGFYELYHGSSYSPVGYFGEEVFQYDECRDSLEFSKLTQKVVDFSKEKMEEVKQRISELPPEVRSVLKPTDFYIVFSTS